MLLRGEAEAERQAGSGAEPHEIVQRQELFCAISESRGWAIPRRFAAWAWVKRSRTIHARSASAASARSRNTAASWGGKPRSRKIFPLESVMVFFGDTGVTSLGRQWTLLDSAAVRHRDLGGRCAWSSSGTHGGRRRHPPSWPQRRPGRRQLPAGRGFRRRLVRCRASVANSSGLGRPAP